MSKQSNQAAVNALGSLSTRKGITLRKESEAEEQAFLDCMKLFSKTLRETNSEAQVTASDITQWATNLSEADPDAVPNRAVNAYSVGRFLKVSCDAVGLTFIGTYGNRSVYTVSEEEPANA